MTAATHSQNYSYRVSRILHWLCAISFGLLVISMPILLDTANNSAERAEVYMTHQSISTIFIFLLMIRLVWKYKTQDNGTRISFEYKWQYYMARTNHMILHFLMIAMPLSGLTDRISHGKAIEIFSVQIIPEINELVHKDVHFIAGEIHLLLLNLFYVLIAFHMLGALMHFISGFFKEKKTT